MTDLKLSLIWDRNDVYPWPWVFADEILTQEIKILSRNKKLSLVAHKYEDGHIYSYQNEAELINLTKAIFSKILARPGNYKQIIKKIRNLCRAFLLFNQHLDSKDRQALSHHQLVKDILIYVKELKKVRLYGWIPALIDGMSEPFMSNTCLEALARELPKATIEEINGYYSILTMPKHYSQTQQSEIEKYGLILKLGAARIKKMTTSQNPRQAVNQFPDSLVKTINSYLTRYSWVTYNYEGPALNINILAKSLAGLTLKKVGQELNLIKIRHDKNLKLKKSLQNRLKLSYQTRELLNMATDFLLLKEYRKSIYLRSYVIIDHYLAEFAKRLGLTLREIKFLHPTEYNSAIASPKLYKKIAKLRSEYCIILIKNGRSRYYYGHDAKAKAKQLIPKIIKSEANELKGLIAFAGKVRGVVKIIHTTQDMIKMRQGDVLVSGSTNPDLLPAMKKAAAFVTDIGGITSHAAIVARELRVPCVVGTKIATKVFKDGDKVEVDATKGIIKKIWLN